MSRVRRTLIFLQGTNIYREKSPREIGIPSFEILDLNVVISASLKPVNVRVANTRWALDLGPNNVWNTHKGHHEVPYRCG